MAEIIHESPANKENVKIKPQSVRTTKHILNKSESIKFINDIKETQMPYKTINFNKKLNFPYNKQRSFNENQLISKVKLS